MNDDFDKGHRRYRYDDTWDVELIFTYVRDHFHGDMPATTALERRQRLSQHRSNLIALGRILLANRSHDMTCIMRGQRSPTECI
eukprot:SAG11_NODE_6842_length_1237_cov_2.188049_2_plen_84_part_00